MLIYICLKYRWFLKRKYKNYFCLYQNHLYLYQEFILIYKIMKKMVEYFGKDVRRINHALKVYDFAFLIAEGEKLPAAAVEITLLTALLHDIGIKEAERKYNSSSAEYQHSEGPPAAENILSDAGTDRKIIDRIKFIIGNHHNYNKIDDIDFQIIAEADFLVNAYEDRLAEKALRNMLEKVFKTETGKELLISMYL